MKTNLWGMGQNLTRSLQSKKRLPKESPAKVSFFVKQVFRIEKSTVLLQKKAVHPQLGAGCFCSLI